jgi:ribose transport system ATP-binding protein
MEEIFRLSDRVTVLRDGQFVTTMETKNTNRQQLVACMVGRELKESYPPRRNSPGEEALRLEHITGNGDYDISFRIRKGEIFGLAGLVGAGRTELAEMLFGIIPKRSGEVFINGKEACIKSPGDAIKKGMGLIPEDRKFLGCLQEMSIRFNISITALKAICNGLLVSNAKEHELVNSYSSRLAIKAPSLNQDVKNLSGGNQQKVVLAKALAALPDILIFDEPTRGIDVGAKQEIYRLMTELADQGKAILMISSELEELLGMSDRIGIIYEGSFMGELEKSQFDPKVVIGLASGMKMEEIL